MAVMKVTAHTADGVLVEAIDGRIGDRCFEFTRIVLSPEAEAAVMSWVPHVSSDRMRELIRTANKGKLPHYDKVGQFDTGRVQRIKQQIEHDRRPNAAWGLK